MIKGYFFYNKVTESLVFFSVNLSSVQEQQLSKAAADDSAFSTDGGTDGTDSDIQSDVLTRDSGIPVSPEDSFPFPVSPEVVPTLALTETSEEAPLPPWLEAVSFKDFSFLFVLNVMHIYNYILIFNLGIQALKYKLP